jgi:hypothetical protein
MGIDRMEGIMVDEKGEDEELIVDKARKKCRCWMIEGMPGSIPCEVIYLDNVACSKTTLKSSLYRGDANEYKTE